MPRSDDKKDVYNINIPIPAHVRDGLQARADKERRSLRQQILLCLEQCAMGAASSPGSTSLIHEEKAPYNATPDPTDPDRSE